MYILNAFFNTITCEQKTAHVKIMLLCSQKWIGILLPGMRIEDQFFKSDWLLGKTQP